MAVKDQVLTFMKQTSEVYSGEKLAQALGVSRTAVWKAIRELEKAGWRFEHTAGGYRYLPSDVLDAAEILGTATKTAEHQQTDVPVPTTDTQQQRLDPSATKSAFLKTSGLPSDLAIEITASTESTMLDAKRAITAGASTPRLFLTESQTGGHGRFGRPFFSPAGQGIYMTLLLNPNHSFQDMPQYTLLAAVAVCRAIAELTGEEATIKWVNDIYLHGKKLVGILSEAQSDMESGTISHIAIGMGLNFSTPQEDFPAELAEKATSLFADGNQTPITRNQLIQGIWRHFFQLLQGLPKDASYLEEYRQRSFVLGQQVAFRRQGIDYQGRATAITDLGELVVTTDSGPVTLNSGEISLSKIGQ